MSQKHRFYLDGFEMKDHISLTDREIVHQCFKVLRLQSGNRISLFHGIDFYDYNYEIQTIDSKKIDLVYIEKIKKEAPKQKINVFQAVPNKLSKLELIIQKCSEIGVNNIYFYKARYSQDPVFLSPQKKQRLQKICKEACEQSNRNSIPKLVFEKSLKLSNIKDENNICFHLEEDLGKEIKDCEINLEKETNIFVGPEGGFHEDEIASFHEIKAQFVYLGNNILRTETVAMVSIFFLINTFS